MNSVEVQYKGYFITNNGLDSGYFVSGEATMGMLWFKHLDDCYLYIDLVSEK